MQYTKMFDWVEGLHEQIQTGQAIVLVTVIAVRGSAPREVGAKMLVTVDGCSGSIGGGQLEYQCSQLATNMLGCDNQTTREIFALGADMEQCCGGVVEILFESMAASCPPWLKVLLDMHSRSLTAVVATNLTGGNNPKVILNKHSEQADIDLPEHITLASKTLMESGGPSQLVDDVFLDVVSSTGFNIVVFGAGHVGTAIITTLVGLDAQIRWVDSRTGVFQAVPPGIQAIEASNPTEEVAAMPPSTFYLVMTHSHKLDFEICQAILTRKDASYCGLIGSRSKRRQFEKRFRKAGISQVLIDHLICPIGVNGIHGKTPKEIAIAVAAEILQVRDREHLAEPSKQNGYAV